jgi:hypothetical protein
MVRAEVEAWEVLLPPLHLAMPFVAWVMRDDWITAADPQKIVLIVTFGVLVPAFDLLLGFLRVHYGASRTLAVSATALSLLAVAIAWAILLTA